MEQAAHSPPEQHVPRRVVLKGALASAAVLAGCSTDAQIESRGTPPPVTTPPSPTETPVAAQATPTPSPIPTATPSGFGGDVAVGSLDEVQESIQQANGFLYLPEARAWLVSYPQQHVEAAKADYPAETHAGLDQGLLCLSQKCPHLGCRVPECLSSGQFECPCHGSMFTPYGEKLDGPSPRGLDLFGVRMDGSDVIIQTGLLLDGVPIGTNLTNWEPTGPSCVTAVDDG